MATKTPARIHEPTVALAIIGGFHAILPELLRLEEVFRNAFGI